MFQKPLAIILITVIASSCKRNDELSPIIILNEDSIEIHYRGEPYIDPGAEAADNFTCNLNDNIQSVVEVDTSKYGSYTVTYTVNDDAGNTSEMIRNVDIVLPTSDYFSIVYNAYDTCTSNNYFYTGLIQDCDCPDLAVTVGNISNFGLSALFTLPLSGTYNEYITLDTTKAAVHFDGYGIMTPGADSIRWEYSISDSISTDVCRSTWIKD